MRGRVKLWSAWVLVAGLVIGLGGLALGTTGAASREPCHPMPPATCQWLLAAPCCDQLPARTAVPEPGGSPLPAEPVEPVLSALDLVQGRALRTPIAGVAIGLDSTVLRV